MTSSNKAKVLSYEDIDELNQQVVDRPVTIFHNLNEPAPCDEDNEEPTLFKLSKLNREKISTFLTFFWIYYFIIFFFWPTMCTWGLLYLTCDCEFICCGPEVSECIKRFIFLIVFMGNVTPGMVWLVIYLVVYAPYTFIYFAVIFVLTTIYMLKFVEADKCSNQDDLVSRIEIE